MRKINGFLPTLMMAALSWLLSGCLKDSCRNTYKIYKPIYKTLTAIRADMRASTPQPIRETGKIYVFGSYIFLNEPNKGIHIIDNSNPASPRNVSFINIPGNVDLAARGQYLYADSYSDIVVLDISNPLSAQPVRFINNVMKDTRNFWGNHQDPDSVDVIVGFEQKDTVIDCETFNRWNSCRGCVRNDANGNVFFTSPSLASAPATGIGGSMARFTIAGNYLYTVSGSMLYTLSLQSPATPQIVKERSLGWGIETIYPFKDQLFIGSRTGMFVFSLADPADPVQTGQFSHATSCDPVIADGSYAYVTLRSGNNCQAMNNQLDVLSLQGGGQVQWMKTYALTNPHGLSKDGNWLFICDGRDGLKIYNAADPMNLQLMKRFEGMESFDVITINGNAIMVAKDGLYQYDYSNPQNIKLISKIQKN